MPQPEPFGLTRAAFVSLWAEASAALIIDGDNAHMVPVVQRDVVACLDHWWEVSPACRSLLEGRRWSTYLDEVISLIATRTVADRGGRLRGTSWQARALNGEESVADLLETIGATEIGDSGETVLTMDEQEFIHLRYRLGLKLPIIALIMGSEDGRARDIGRSAHEILGDLEGLLDDLEEEGDDNLDDPSDLDDY